MRLDHHVARSADLSRKSARALISAGRVCVNGLPVSQAGTRLAAGDQVTLDGQVLSVPGHRYLMLHKPPGVVTATRDDRHRTVLDLVPADCRRDLHPAGRLDQDTTGLVLLTTDGDWSHRITSPRTHLLKSYRVILAEPVTDAAIESLSEGILLRNETRATRPATVRRLDQHSLVLGISEGRYHQVKRMFGALGNRVVSLHRQAIGPVELDGTLQQGAWRPLTEDELQALSRELA